MNSGIRNFHDSGLIKLNLDFEQRLIEIVIEEEVGGKKWDLRFSNVSNISIDNLNSLSDFDLVEVNSISILETNNGFNVKIILLLGFGKPSWELSFNYKDLWTELIDNGG
ncbi:hypothetical protein [Pseudoflavitalea rhizosphaerae]|uniref:hypothetical protein n=1 Tax=Pseudoflavitalea rhizosphaerae TaxID=1884793 RepID=UPI000F8DC1FE|nr:hypothetical protein [Pseudoflavitalea rhizosphaerae]